jgi:hypothetical protein
VDSRNIVAFCGLAKPLSVRHCLSSRETLHRITTVATTAGRVGADSSPVAVSCDGTWACFADPASPADTIQSMAAMGAVGASAFASLTARGSDARTSTPPTGLPASYASTIVSDSAPGPRASSSAAAAELGGLVLLSGSSPRPVASAPTSDATEDWSRPPGCLKRKANAALFLDALSPCDHSHLLHSEEHGIQKGGLLHQILEKDSQLFPYAVKARSRETSAHGCVSSSSSFSSVASSSSFASAASSYINSESHVVQSFALDQDYVENAGKKTEPNKVRNEVIYPRRKIGEDSRRSHQVVVSPEILKEHFDMPLQDAAAKLGVCATAIKKACRRFGIPKWPFRDRLRRAQESFTVPAAAACGEPGAAHERERMFHLTVGGRAPRDAPTPLHMVAGVKVSASPTNGDALSSASTTKAGEAASPMQLDLAAPRVKAPHAACPSGPVAVKMEVC